MPAELCVLKSLVIEEKKMKNDGRENVHTVALMLCVLVLSVVFGTKQAAAYNSHDTNPRVGHNFVFEKAVDAMGDTWKYPAARLFPLESYLPYLYKGSRYADNTRPKCKWKYPGGQQEFSCDTIHHYVHADDIELVETLPLDIRVKIAHPGQVTAGIYAQVLFDLALKFWPSGAKPDFDSLPVMDAGEVCITGSNCRDLGTTTLGALPLCHREECEQWPDWAGGETAQESIKTSLTYLGWAIHLLQDATTYYHAQNEVSQGGHEAFENYVDQQISLGHFDPLPSCSVGKIMMIPIDRPMSEIVRFAASRNLRKMVFWSGAVCGLDDAVELTAAVLNKFFSHVGFNKQGIEWDVNRIGGDYRWFDMDAEDPLACRDACVAEERCRSFTYAPPGFVSTSARCHLKSAIPHPTFTNAFGLASGVVREDEGMENNVDRIGADYHWFDMQDEDPNDCRDACVDDDRCRAFTYAPPGFVSTRARCHLKTRVPGATFAYGVVSGVVEPVENGPWTDDTIYVGGNGGTEKSFRCPENMLAAGLVGATYANGYVSNLGLVCAPKGQYTPGRQNSKSIVFAGGSKDVNFHVTTQEGEDLNTYLDTVLARGESTLKPGRQSQVLCPERHFLKSVRIRSERALSSIYEITCQKPGDRDTVDIMVEGMLSREIGTYANGEVFELSCDGEDAYASGMQIRSGYFTDGVSFSCRYDE